MAAARARGFLNLVGRMERWISFCAFLVLIGVIFADVVTRELTGTGLHWARQTGVYANIFVVMIGFGMASSGGTHLRPRFADHWLPADWEPVLVRLQEATMALFCLGFAVVAFQVLAQTYAIHERSVVLQVAVWPFQAVIPVVFVIAAVRHGLYAAQPQLRPVERGGGGS